MGEPLTAVSLFSGIGGFDLALASAGVRVVAGVEIDDDCRRVLARQFPDTMLLDDVTEVTGEQLRTAGFVPERGILAGGWPCQDLSIAGLRAGLGGARSGLFWHIVRLADNLRPRWLILENVPGLLSAVCPCPGSGACVRNHRAVRCGEWRGNRDHREWFPEVPHGVQGGACPGGCMASHGGAMGAVVGALGKLGYGFAWRVLDAQYFGVPQRRERLFFVGCLGDRAAPVEILFEPESSDRDSAPRRPARTGLARPPARRADSTGGRDDPAGRVGDQPDVTAWTVHAAESCARQRHAFETTVARCLDTTGGFASGQGGTVVAATLQGGGRRGHRIDAEGAAGGHLLPVPVALRGRDAGSNVEAGEPGSPAFALRTPGGGSSYPMVAHAVTSREGKDPDSDATSGMIIAHALTAQTARGGAVTEDGTGRGIPVIAHALTSEGADASEDGTGRGTPIVPIGMPQAAAAAPVAAPLTAGSAAGTGVNRPGRRREDDINLASVAAAVRRLSPVECERLQGFPDGWTEYQAGGARQSDSARYRQLGNAVAVPVVAWIAARTAAAHQRIPLEAP